MALPSVGRARAAALYRSAVVLAAFLVVEGLCRCGIIPASVMPPPTSMAIHAVQILYAGTFSRDIALTLSEVCAATLLTWVVGFASGLALHRVPHVRRGIEPLLSSYYAVPTFIFYPVFIVLFGVGAVPIIAIAVLLAVVSMITATLEGLDHIRPVLRKTARVMRLSTTDTVVRVIFPAILPYLFTGARLSVAYAFIGVIASEFILSGAGVGYAIGYAYNNFQNADMYALMLIVLVAVTLVNAVLNRLDAKYRGRGR